MNIDRIAEDAQRLLEGHILCPSCSGARPGQCCGCNQRMDLGVQELSPDPYRTDVDDDFSLHLLCRTCFRQGMEDAAGMGLHED